jgi:hypothetical protein
MRAQASSRDSSDNGFLRERDYGSND